MKNDIFPTGLTFDDVLLEPQFSRVVRGQTDVTCQLTKKITLSLPILAAAMDTVSDEKMAIALGRLGGLAVLHRNTPVTQQVRMVRKVKKGKVICGAAVGPHDFDRARALVINGADIIFIDCAHAHFASIIADAKKMKKQLKSQLVVGNMATAEAAQAYCKFADAVKVGIGPGSICTTRIVAGIGVPQLTAVMNVVSVARKYKVPVIADGGIKYSGDIVKALAGGASSVMLGSLLAGTDMAPGRLVKIKGELYKEYRGMGSLGAMNKGNSTDRYFQKGAKKYVPEGVEGLIPYKGKLADVIWQMIGGLHSGMGYIGADKIADIPKQAKFIKITNAGLKESHPHSLASFKKALNY